MRTQATYLGFCRLVARLRLGGLSLSQHLLRLLLRGLQLLLQLRYDLLQIHRLGFQTLEVCISLGDI